MNHISISNCTNILVSLKDTFYVISVYYVSVSRVAGVKINILDVPEVAKAGHTVRLTCDYDLQRARLYQVKWYKGSHEFFRYSPSEEQKIKVFTVEGLNIDVSFLNIIRDLTCWPFFWI